MQAGDALGSTAYWSNGTAALVVTSAVRSTGRGLHSSTFQLNLSCS